MGLRQAAESLKTNLPEEDNSLFFKIQNEYKKLLTDINIKKGGFLYCTGDGFYKLSFVEGILPKSFNTLAIPCKKIYDLYVKKGADKLGDFFLGGALSEFKNFFVSIEETMEDVYFLPMDEKHDFFMFAICQKNQTFNPTTIAKDKIEKFLRFYSSYKYIIETAYPIFQNTNYESVLLKAETAFNFGKFADKILISLKGIFNFDYNNLDILNLYYSLVNKIKLIIGKSNITILKNKEEIYACVFSSKGIPMDIYIAQSQSILENLYGKKLSEKIKITHSGTSNSLEDIKDFLKIS